MDRSIDLPVQHMSVILIKSLVILNLLQLATDYNSSRFKNLSRIHSVVSANLSKLEVKIILIRLKHRMHSKFAPVSIKCQSTPVTCWTVLVQGKWNSNFNQDNKCFMIKTATLKQRIFYVSQLWDSWKIWPTQHKLSVIYPK